MERGFYFWGERRIERISFFFFFRVLEKEWRLACQIPIGFGGGYRLTVAIVRRTPAARRGRDQVDRGRIPVKQMCAGGCTFVEELFQTMLGVDAHLPLPTRVPTSPGGVP